MQETYENAREMLAKNQVLFLFCNEAFPVVLATGSCFPLFQPAVPPPRSHCAYL